MYTYLFLLLFTLLFPLLFSFERRWIKYYQSFPALFLSLFIVALFFVVWDEWFTQMGVWSFNKNYVSGIYILSLPVEEWLFFLIIPYSCVFIYESFRYFMSENKFLQNISLRTAYISSAALFIIGIVHYDRIYTFVTFMLAAICILVHVSLFGKKYWGYFVVTYFVHLIPFFIVNGILTSLPVVSYNDQENLGIRLGTIPVDDSIYSFLLLLMNISLFEYFREKFFTKNVLHHG